MVINSRNKQAFKIGLFVLVAMVFLGIGYAAISNISLMVNTTRAITTVNQENFNVHFVSVENITGSSGVGGSSNFDGVNAVFDVSGLSKVGDYAIAKYTVRNDSAAIGTEITISLTNSNPEYFKVTETIDDDKLQAGEQTYATVRVEMIKTPIQDDVTTIVTATLKAAPIENANATGGSKKTIVNPKEYVFTANTSSNKTYVGQAIPNGVTKHQTFDSAASTLYGGRQALMHLIDNGVISESYVQFKRDGVTYTLRGGINEEDLPEANREIYKENVQVLTNAFGANKCRTEVDEDFDNWVTYFCQIGGDNASVTTTGHVSYAGGFSYCRVDASYTGPSSSYCYTS